MADGTILTTGVTALQDDKYALQSRRVKKFLEFDQLFVDLFHLLLTFFFLKSTVFIGIKIVQLDPAVTFDAMCISHKVSFKLLVLEASGLRRSPQLKR